MRILHLLANYKLTGPAEPALRLAAHLRDRGHEVHVTHMAVPAHVPREATLLPALELRRLETGPALRLPKHARAAALLRDVPRLAAWIDAQAVDVVHTHLLGDHLTGALAVARSRRRPLLVRTNHEAVPLRPTLRHRFLLPRRTDLLMEASRLAYEADRARFGLPEERMALVDGAIDLARFDPTRPLPDLRPRLGLEPDDFVVGIAARVQPRRRFEVLLEAVARLRTTLPRLRLVVIGRGTHLERVAVEPARALGIDDITRFPGYLRGDDYVAGLLALDVKVFLYPGTDGTCRAAREAMALGRPVVASRLGMLPELVTPERDGLLVDLEPEALAAALARLAGDPALRARLGAGARATALERFDPARQAQRVEAAYERVRAARGVAPPDPRAAGGRALPGGR